MKRSAIIALAIVTWIVSMIGMAFGVDEYIKAKDIRLNREIHNKVEEVFGGRKYVDVAYSGYKVSYEKIAMPAKPDKSAFNDPTAYQQLLNEWQGSYGDLTKLYRIKWGSNEWLHPYEYEDGWNLVQIESDWEGVTMTWYFPYAVGYKKQDYSWGFDYAPSVETAVSEAFSFFTTNPNSNFVSDGEFEKGSVNRIMAEARECANEYYWLWEDSVPRHHIMGKPLFEKYPKDINNYNYPLQCTFMYNGYYKVFVARSQPKTYTIVKKSWNPDEKDKEKLWKYWGVGLTILMLLIVIPLWIIDHQRKKIKEESLYDKLKRLCNPAKFLKDYDKEKVDKANMIYQRLMEIKPDDKEALMSLQAEAVASLGIVLIDAEKLKDLTEKVNPQRFMNPYNAEKIKLANDLYSRLTKEGLTYEEFAEIEETSKSL